MQPFCFLDLETTGHEPLRLTGAIESVAPFTRRPLFEPYHEIIDIGAIFADPQDLSVLGEFETKVMPKHPERCGPEAAHINGYPGRAKEGEWSNAPSLAEAIVHFIGTIDGHEFGPVNLIGQNFFFDWTFWLVALAECGMSEDGINRYFHYKKLDTASMAVQTLLGPEETYDPKNFSLRSGRLQVALGIEPEPLPHTALNGAYQAYKTFCALRQLKKAR